MPATLPISDLSSQVQAKPSVAGSSESDGVLACRSFHEILSQQGREGGALVPVMQFPVVVAGEIRALPAAVELISGPDGSILDATPQLEGVSTEQGGVSGDVAEPGGVASGADPALLWDGTRISAGGPAYPPGGPAYPPGSGDFDQTADQAVTGILPPDGKIMPSPVQTPGSGPQTGAGIGMVHPARQGALPGDPETAGLVHAGSITDGPVVSSPAATRVLAGTAGGELSPLDNPGDVQWLNPRPTADNPVAMAAVAGGKPAVATAPEAARQSSWSLDPPIHSRDWENGFGDRILWLVNKRQPVAELRLNPPHLGSVEVRIAVQGDQAQVHFQVPSGAVRDAVEAALPRLRDLFTEAGIDLSDVGVSDHPSREQSHADEESERESPRVGTQVPESGTETDPAESQTIRSNSRLDLFA